MTRRTPGTKDRLRPFALVVFLAGWAVLAPTLLLFIDNKERYGINAVPAVLGPFFVQAGDWLIGGFFLALACFVTAIVVKTRDAAQARREGRRSGPWTRTGQVLLSIATCGIMGLALLYIALDTLFPVEYQRMDPPSKHGCTVVLETRTGMANQSGRVFLLPSGATELVDTGITWYYDDGRLIDPVWTVTWNGHDATLHAPDGVPGFQQQGSMVQHARTATFTCE